MGSCPVSSSSPASRGTEWRLVTRLLGTGHLGVNADTARIEAVELTTNDVDDGSRGETRIYHG
jgi:hypothetical protein